jgi:putative restriction endonuclease
MNKRPVGGFMAKGVFTTKVTPSYDDLPEQRYHFPRTYLNQVRQIVGDHFVYYEPRRATAELSSRGGRQVYFAVARVREVIEDRAQPDSYYALVDSYLDFDRPVPFREGDHYYEGLTKKDDGSTNKGAMGRAVRIMPDAEFDVILKAGFAPVLDGQAPELMTTSLEIDEPEIPFERPIVELTVSRRFRERSFMYNVRSAYKNRCAFTGLRLINGGGRPEVQAAHIQPVAADGPDSVRNGLALSGTVHWMFDRGLVSIGDDHAILIAKNHLPEDAVRLLNASGTINVPSDPTLAPNPRYLNFHRTKVFKG